MSSTTVAPLDQQAPPASIVYGFESGHGSIGPVIAVLVVIVILGVLAGMMGRLCSGRSIMGYGQYDVESWAESKCSTCIDGRMSFPPPSRGGGNVSGGSTPVAAPPQAHNQDELDQSPPQNHPPSNVDS